MLIKVPHTHAQPRRRHLRRSSEYQIVHEMLEVDLPAHPFFLISFILVILVVVVVIFIMIVFIFVVKDSKRDQYTCEPPLIETVLPSRTMVDSVRVITRPRLSV
jgi:heme/copper-type cytochrome/quinol oxidase subunit 2